MNIIPSATAAHSHPGSFRLSALTPIRMSDPALERVAGIFQTRLSAWVDHRAAPDLPSRPGSIRLALEGAITELDGTAPPRGTRADVDGTQDEAYVLTVDPGGATVRSPSAEGVHRGLTTLLQLAATSEVAGDIPCGTVIDSPRFAWRGLSVDVARVILSVDELEKIIDLADMYKLNTLHLHLTDDAGWRIPITSWPELTTGGPSYTESDYEHVIAYAAERFITVVPEIDMPAHCTAATTAYPALGNPASGRFSAATLDPQSDMTWRFVADVIRDLTAMTPGRFIHLGGDEAFGLTPAEHAAFVGRAAQLIRTAGKEVIGWQEAARAQLPPGSIVQHWIEHDKLRRLVGAVSTAQTSAKDSGIPADLVHRLLDESSGDLSAARRQNAWMLLSPASLTYLDRRYAKPSLEPAQEAERARLGHPLYPPTLVRDSLDWEADLLSDHIDPTRIVGIEAAVWGETTASVHDVELLLLPRLPLVASQGWSHSRLPWSEARQRISAHAPLWASMDLQWFASNEIPW